MQLRGRGHRTTQRSLVLRARSSLSRFGVCLGAAIWANARSDTCVSWKRLCGVRYNTAPNVPFRRASGGALLSVRSLVAYSFFQPVCSFSFSLLVSSGFVVVFSVLTLRRFSSLPFLFFPWRDLFGERMQTRRNDVGNVGGAVPVPHSLRNAGRMRRR